MSEEKPLYGAHMALIAQTQAAILGTPRALTPGEQANLDRVTALRDEAARLRMRADELDAEAAAIEPKNLYPDSPLPKLLDSLTLLPNAGATYTTPRLRRHG